MRVELYDTMSRARVRLPDGRIRIYLCGVTVYDDSHIGHARTIVVFDVLRRYLEYAGYGVILVQNFTDIDDKIIERAGQEGRDALELAAGYISRYHEDFDRLNVRRASVYPKATGHIDDIIRFIEKLIESGAAYAADSGVYYAVESFAGYGRLSGKDIDEMISGARVEPEADKHNPLDFALWKRIHSGVSWKSPWGKGRPGWHIECSAMSLRYLGEDFEIHGGGRDLIFPHHENEIAQTESRTGRRLAQIWMHTGMVTMAGQKMSKSLGNVKSTRILLERWGSNVLRLFCLSGHYRKPIDYSESLLAESLALWRRIEACYCELIQSEGEGGHAHRWHEEFEAALASDMNTHAALAAVSGMAREIGELAGHRQVGAAERKEFGRMLDILGLQVVQPSQSDLSRILSSVQQRNALRKAGRWKEADAIRGQLAGQGITLMDRRDRTIWVLHEEIPGIGT